jgi:hypothetical protein
MNMHFLPEQPTEFLGSSDRRARVRRNPPAVTYLEMGEGNGGIVLNVSETGLAIAVAQSFAETQIPLLTFRLPQFDRTFKTSGEVVWRSESQKSAGIRFVDLAEPDRMQIRNWIRAEIVAAELQTPQERNRARATAKSVLIMPSPRHVVRQAESEAVRDEARAAEFDRMFPSESSLNTAQPSVEAEWNSEIVHAAKTENAANEFLAHEEFARDVLGAKAAQTESEDSLLASSEFPVVEPAADEIAVVTDWRDEWEQFHRQRENLERVRTFEPIQNLPVQSILADSTLRTSSASEPPAAAVPTARPDLRRFDWPAEKQEQVILQHAGVVEGSPETMVGPPSGERQKSPLGIAALSIVLVVMCFILGYAIQPGAFGFLAAKLADTDKEAVTPNFEQQPAQEGEPTVAAPVPARNSVPGALSGFASAEHKQKEPPAASAENSGSRASSPDRHSVPRPAVDLGPLQPVAQTAAPAISPAAPPAPSEAAKSAPSAPGISNTTSTSIATTSAATALVPVSFFPVTAPSGGSAPKLMQLPEETISETPAMVIRSRQFLFVPAQPGPESTHELERVHIGDRIATVDPIFPQQSLGNAPGGSVHLRTKIGTDGAVWDVQPISGPTALIPAAASALRQWRYKPTDIDGTPIPVEEDVVIEFRPRH